MSQYVEFLSVSHGNNHMNSVLAYQEPHKKRTMHFDLKRPHGTLAEKKTENGGFCSFVAENQVTTSQQTAFCDRIIKTHRTTPSKVALFASG